MIYVQLLNITMADNQDYLNILRRIEKNPKISQRLLAKDLGFSLGKLNYCIKELNKKRLIKMSNFSKSKKKLNYIYLLTPKGILRKSELMYLFLKKKSKEYEDLKREVNL